MTAITGVAVLLALLLGGLCITWFVARSYVILSIEQRLLDQRVQYSPSFYDKFCNIYYLVLSFFLEYSRTVIDSTQSSVFSHPFISLFFSLCIYSAIERFLAKKKLKCDFSFAVNGLCDVCISDLGPFQEVCCWN